MSRGEFQRPAMAIPLIMVAVAAAAAAMSFFLIR